ncbi:hypothetical protein [Dorea longicatena]|uniref:hypothetical protein n=1 Tax=Dorea longicatena TaxID=88431 RepID=UPI0034A1D49F
MGEKDTGTRTLYMMDSNGQKYELGGLQEQDNRILIHGDSDEYLEKVTGSFTMEIDIKKLKHTQVWRKLFGVVLQNNWRKYHGLPMRRRKWLRQ